MELFITSVLASETSSTTKGGEIKGGKCSHRGKILQGHFIWEIQSVTNSFHFLKGSNSCRAEADCRGKKINTFTRQIYPPNSLRHDIPKIKITRVSQVRYFINTNSLRCQGGKKPQESLLSQNSPCHLPPYSTPSPNMGLQKAEQTWAKLGQPRLWFGMPHHHCQMCDSLTTVN